MKAFWTWALAVFGVAVLCIASGLVGGALAKDMVPSAHQMTYTDFVSVMLTAISVLLTLLALIIALIAVIGWNTINRGARRQVERYLEQGFEDGRPLYLKLQALMFEGISRIDTDLGHEDDKKQEKGDQDD